MKSRRRLIAIQLFAFGLLSVQSMSGCARARLALTGSLIQDVAAAASKNDDVDLVSEAAPTWLLLVEGLLERHPHDRSLLIAAAEAYTSYGAIVEIKDPERARRIYERAKHYGLSALSRNERVAELLSAPFEDFESVPAALDSRDLKTVFWAASSWGAWISANTTSMAALAQLPRVILLMEWVLEEDESYYHGSPHIFLGVYHAALPPALGGDAERSLHHFDRAEELSGGHAAMVYVQKARFYARQTFDRELYESLLHTALSVQANGIPELTLQNEVAKRMAMKLLDEADEFF